MGRVIPFGDSPEVEAWVKIMGGKSDDATRGMMIKGFITSYEFNDDWVKKLYATLLRRRFDAGGYAQWMNWLATGSDLEDILVRFLSSAEYYNHGPYGPPPAGGAYWGGVGGPLQ